MRLSSKTVLAGAALAALAFAVQPAAAAVALNGELNATANAYADGHPSVNSSDHQAWSGVPATLDTSVFVQASGGVFHDHNEKVTVQGDAEATWASANSGAVNFTNYGWEFNTISGPDEADLDGNRPGDGADWTYTFQAAGNGVFTMDYNVVGTGDTGGLYGWQIFFSGGGSGGPDINSLAADPTISGEFTGAIFAGQTYTISLYGNPNAAHFGPFHEINSMDGTFNWQIDERPVVDSGTPEPATWALMLGGFGLAGAALRRRKAARAA